MYMNKAIQAALAATVSLTALAGAAFAQETLTLGIQGSGAFGEIEPHSLTGDKIADVSNNFNVFESLTRQSNDGELEFVLATSVEPEDETGTVWTIHLREGVTFHDGSAMTADDVIFSIERIKQPGTISSGHIGPVEKIEKIDDLTVRITLGAPRSWLPIGLSDPFASIVPEGFEPGTPIGTGPYRITQINTAQGAVLEVNETYWGDAPKTPKVVVQLFEDPSAMLNALRTGQVDIVRGIEPSIVGEVEGDDSISIYRSPTGKMYPIQMRTDTAPFDDPRLRKALQLVLDRDAVLWSVYNGYGEIASDLYGRYDPDFATDLKRERDVEEARRLVQEAGLDGTSLTLTMNEDVGTALVLAENAREIGLDITVQDLDSASFYNEEYFERAFFGGDYYPSGPYWLLSSLIDAPEAGLDQIKWRDEEYLALWSEASRTTDAAARSEIMMQMQQILFDRGAWIVSVYPEEVALYETGLTGLPEHDYTGAGVLRALPDLVPSVE